VPRQLHVNSYTDGGAATKSAPSAPASRSLSPFRTRRWTLDEAVGDGVGQCRVVVDGYIPSDLATGTPEEIDEERRLLYVAMTRARDDLVLMQPLRFFMRGQARGGDFAPRSRFIAACDLDAFELIGGQFSCGAENGMTGRPVANIDLKTRMREIWRC
jgi:UvrD-like helicase C-terminal domain